MENLTQLKKNMAFRFIGYSIYYKECPFLFVVKFKTNFFPSHESLDLKNLIQMIKLINIWVTK